MKDDASLAKFLRALDSRALTMVSDEDIIRIATQAESKTAREWEVEGDHSAPFDLVGHAATIAALAITVGVVWGYVASAYKIGKTLVQFLRDADSIADLMVDDNKKLELVEGVIRRLRAAGLESASSRVERWVEAVLERLTRPQP